MDTVDTKKWSVIYPLYINSEFTRAKGRKTSLANSVKNPTIVEISIIMKNLNIPFVEEKIKRHPCDYFNFGRVRYSLTNENNVLYNSEIRNKKLLFNKLGNEITELKKKNEKKIQPQKFKKRRNKN